MFSKAKWVWTSEDDGKRNFITRFRKTFELEHAPDEYKIAISADSRYILFVNGVRVNEGPPRSYDFNKQYDSLDIAPFLVSGTNVVACQVARFGVVSGQYLGGPGGLILESKNGEICTDSSWKTSVHPGFFRFVPRHAWGQHFTESFDAQLYGPGWESADYDDTGWETAVELGPAGLAPWTGMEENFLPKLARRPHMPVRVSDFSFVIPPENALAFDVHAAIAESTEENGGPLRHRILACEFVCDKDCTAEMHRMNTAMQMDTFDFLRLNGKDVTFNMGKADLELKSGSNYVAIYFYDDHQSSPSWVFSSECALTVKGIGKTDGPASFYAADSREDDVMDTLWKADNAAEAENYLDKLRQIPNEAIYTDVYALSNNRKALDIPPPHSNNMSAMLSESADYTQIECKDDCDTEFLVDFGEETVGYLAFEVCAPAGTVFDFNCFEAVMDTAWRWTDNLNNTFRYVAKDGWQRFTSTVRRGFRFVQVTIRNASANVKIREISAVATHYPVNAEGSFCCSDTFLTKVWEMGARTTKLCMEDAFVDCPAYEQTYWVGDARNEALAAFSAFGDTLLNRRSLKLAADSLTVTPTPACAVPAVYAWVIPNWSMLWVISCEEYYMQTADTEFVEEIYPAIKKTCDYLVDQINADGVMHFPAWNMIDWAPMDSPWGSLTAHENAFFAETLRRASRLADLAGSSDSKTYKKVLEGLLPAIDRVFWDESKNAYIDCVHTDGTKSSTLSEQTHVLLHMCDCIPPEKVSLVESYIKSPPADWVKIGSPWMMWFKFASLAKMGDYSRVLELTREHWREMEKCDATTCWETFEAWHGSLWYPTRSWCHAWSAAPTYFQSTCQLGVSPLSPGYKKVLVAPKPCGLTWAKGRVPTTCGTMLIDWTVDGETFNMKVVHPPGMSVETSAPEGFSDVNIEVFESSVTSSPLGVF